jgi:hypothetical protein
MGKADQLGIYGTDYLTLLLAPAPDEGVSPRLPELPAQAEVDRLLSSYEAWVIGANPTELQSQGSAPVCREPSQAKPLAGVTR